MTDTKKILDYLQQFPTLEALLKMAEQDSEPITEVNYAYKMSTNASVYNKYNTICASISDFHRRLDYKQEYLASKLMRYYTGNPLDGEELLDKNLRAKTKTEAIKFIDLDVEYIKLKNQIKEIEILKATAYRILEFHKYEANNINKFFDYVRYSNGAY